MDEHNTDAVQAAAEAVLAVLDGQMKTTVGLGPRWLRTLAFDAACAAVDAASPVIASQTVEAMQDTVIAEVGTVMAARRGELEAAVRADERAKITVLAERHRALCDCQCSPPLARRVHPRSFAEMLRELP